QASDELVSRITNEMSLAGPSKRRSSVQPRFRFAGMSAAIALGVLVIGGAGFAMNSPGHFIETITHGTFVSKHITVHKVVLNAANDQYSTTTTATTTSSSTTNETTTTQSDGTKSTQAPPDSSG